MFCLNLLFHSIIFVMIQPCLFVSFFLRIAIALLLCDYHCASILFSEFSISHLLSVPRVLLKDTEERQG